MNFKNREESRSRRLLYDLLMTANSTYWSINKSLCDQSGSTDKKTGLWSSLASLHQELKAAHALSYTVEDTGVGWPTEIHKLLQTNDERSGYPSDLVTAMLEQAEALSLVLCRSCVGSRNTFPADEDAVNALLCSIRLLVAQAIDAVSNQLMENKMKNAA